MLPQAEVPSITWDNGVLCNNYVDLILRDLKGLIRAEDVYNEWDAQIRKILDTGLSVTHIDGHQHMHMWNHFSHRVKPGKEIQDTLHACS